jgi:NADPH:quinone reductase-like Zn-dependent oxidoreductase/SAM-dependent methyltransferase/acyl carrier protein
MAPQVATARGQVAMLPSLRENKSDWQQMLSSLGELYVRGVEIDWVGFDRTYQRRKVILPTYPFQRERYWVDLPKIAMHPFGTKRQASLPPLIDKMIRLPLHDETVFETEFSVERFPFLADHRVYETLVSPGACQLAMALSAAELTFGKEQSLCLTDVILPQALVIPEGAGGALTVQVVSTPVTANRSGPKHEFKLISFDPQAETVEPRSHATGYVVTPANSEQNDVDLAALQRRCDQALDIASLYAAAVQIELGPRFRWLAGLWQAKDGDEALAKLYVPDTVGTVTAHLLHPGLLDACFQVASMAGLEEGSGEANDTRTEKTMLPFAVGALQLLKPARGHTWWCHARKIASHKWDIRLLDEQAELIAAINGFEVRAASAEAVRRDDDWYGWLYQVQWQPRPYFGLLPDYLPTPATIVRALLSSAPTLWTKYDGDKYQRLLTALEELSIEYVLAAFAKVGFTFQAGAQWRSSEMARQIGVIPSYRRLLERLLAMLAEVGILTQTKEAWRVVKVPRSVNPVASITTLQAHLGNTPELTLLARSGEKLSEVLRGVQEPLELLFPAGDTSVASQLYTDSPAALMMNSLVQQVVKNALGSLPKERGLRILEVGAGTGGTTAGLLPLLPAAQTDYLFTDIGPTFLRQAQARFADYSFVRYQPLDIEQRPTEQGFTRHQADLVIAANVLHATKNLTETLTHLRQLLQPGGQLVLLEATSRRRWVDLTFGLTDGWWRFADKRQDHPLLTADQWKRLLLANGFQAVETIEQGGQAVIVAQAKSKVELSDRTWLLFADTKGIGEALATQLRQRGERPILIYAGECYQQVEAYTFTIRPDSASDYRRVLTAFPATHGIVHLWSLDLDTPHQKDGADLVSASQQSCGTVLHLVQALLHEQIESAGLWLVTSDAQAVTETDAVNGVAQSALWGMGQVIALEHPELNCVRIDLNATGAPEALATQLCAEITFATITIHAPREDQVAWRRDERYVARLTRYQAEQGVVDGPYLLTITERGTLDNLQLRAVTRRAPASGEVEIQVQASGLNFRDVLNALGLYPGDPGAIGAECVGVIVAVGDEVSQFTVGDAVLAVAPESFSQYVTVSAARVTHKPATLNAAEAATIPTVFLTAYYGLQQLAQMKAGDRVLIHAAAGGVGMAAVQLAKLVGAEVFGTASPRKWEALRELGLTHIYNSRTLDFAEQVMADTDGDGVDIILNSLTGPGFINANLSTLAAGGYLVEMSKRNVWSAEQVAAVRPDVRYTPFDLGEVSSQQPHLLQTMFAEVMPLFSEKKLKPLPYTAFPIQEAVGAFRYMQQAKHIGKIVLTPPITHTQAIQADATYLITGGLGGLGLAVAQWLAEQGARHLLLVGRSEPKPEAQPQLKALAEMEVAVTVAQADVTILSQLTTVLEQVDKRYPIRGLIHSVGVLDDGALLQQNWKRFDKVFSPKMQGAWHLHQLTKKMPLDFFVLFSSAASLLGNRGQANHAAANAFLDAFVHYRRAQGLPALSINWGAWSEVGAAAELVRSNQMAARGHGVISPRQGIDAFAHLLGQNAPQVGVIPIHWPKFLRHNATNSPFYQAFKQFALSVTSDSVEQSVDIRQQLASATDEERRALLMQYLRATTASVLGLHSSEQIDPHQGLVGMGLDSLMAIELRNHVQQQLEIELSVTTYLQNRSIVQLAQQLEEKYLIPKGHALSNPSQAAAQRVVNAVVHKTKTAKTRKIRVTI